MSFRKPDGTYHQIEPLEKTFQRDREDAERRRAANADATGSMKPTNPKDAVGSVKCPLSTVPSPFLQALGVAMLEGALKYGKHNYRSAGVRASVYFDAVVNRHMIPWWEGEDIDPDSLLNHLVKAAAGLAVIYDSVVMGNWIDDRPVRNPNFRKHFDEMNIRSAELIKKYPEPKEPFTEIPNVLRRAP